MKQQRVTRRDFLKIVGATAVAGAAWQWGARGWATGLAEISTSRVLMGTVINLTVLGEDRAAAESAVAATLSQMSRLEALLSRHQPGSELSQLNQNGRLAHASRPLLDLIHSSHRLSEQSGGGFDISVKPLMDLYQAHQARGALPSAAAVANTLPLVDYQNIQVEGNTIQLARPGMGITVDGIGKGYIVDAGTAVLRQHGFVNVLVEAGGDLMASGSKAANRPWRIGLQSPRGGGIQTRFSLHNRAAATSGDYLQTFTADLRQHHILDPRTGYSAPDLASVTVTAPSAMLADGLATAVMALGPPDGLALLAQHASCEGMMITKDMAVIATENFARG